MSEVKNPEETPETPDPTVPEDQDLSDVADDDAVIAGLEDDVKPEGGAAQ